MGLHARLAFAAAACVGLCAGTASAQQAEDTLRLAFSDPISGVLVYDDPQPETGATSRAVFDPLMCFNVKTGKVDPLLAESWEWSGDTTLRVVLRDDVTFHDGSAFDANDVVYTLNWLADPNSKLRFRDNWSWIKEATKVDAHTVEIHTNGISPIALTRLAVSTPMLPSDTHGELADKSTFGKQSPVGTGPYKVERLDASSGIVLVKNEAYPQANECSPAADIGRIEIRPIPDAQTQIAEFSTGGLDVVKVDSKDQSDMLATLPGSVATATQGITYHYMALDSINRSGNEALSNPEVRKALMQAIDRQLVASSIVPGGDEVKPVDGLCLPIQEGCAFSSAPPEHDLEAAKKSLTEAGYPEGLALEITATPGAENLAEAIAGELRKVGVAATVDRLTFTAYRQKQGDGRIQALVGQWTSGGLPDASSPASFFFSKGPRDYYGDAEIVAWSEEALQTLDLEKRKALYQRIYDRANEMMYVLPISTKPAVFVHSDTLTIGKGSLNTYGADLNEMRWAD